MKRCDCTSLQVYFIRHGETQLSHSEKLMEHMDIPLTAKGEVDARNLRKQLRHLEFAHVLTSPFIRARQTCTHVGLNTIAQIDPDLAEWDYGDYEGLSPKDIRTRRLDWNLFRDGCPHGETPPRISDRIDRVIARLRLLVGNVAIISHGRFGAALAARWIGLPVPFAQHFPLDTASLSILQSDPSCQEKPVIRLWNAPSGLLDSSAYSWDDESGHSAPLEIDRSECQVGLTG